MREEKKAAHAAVAGPKEAVAYLDIGEGGYLDLGSDLSDEALRKLPKGRHMLAIVGTYGVDGYVPVAAPTPAAQAADSVQEPFGYFRPAPFGWEDCAPSDEGAVALYAAPQPAPVAPTFPLLAKTHTGMCVDYSGLLGQCQHMLRHEVPGNAEMLRQLQGHLRELGQRWYAGDMAVVDEFLQLYCIEQQARAARAHAKEGGAA